MFYLCVWKYVVDTYIYIGIKDDCQVYLSKLSATSHGPPQGMEMV